MRGLKGYSDAAVGSLGVEHCKPRTTVEVELTVKDPPVVPELFQVFDHLLHLKRGGQTVYFGIGHGSFTMLEYAWHNEAPRCDPDANPAEYILNVIGAGATATSSIDWHTIGAYLRLLHSRSKLRTSMMKAELGRHSTARQIRDVLRSPSHSPHFPAY